MQSEAKTSDSVRASRALKAKVTRNATHHLEHIAGRSALVFRLNGLFRQDDPATSPELPDDALLRLSDPTHHLRLASSSGPMILSRDEHNKNHIWIAPAEEMLFSTAASVRSAALKHITTLGTIGALIGQTRGILATAEAEILSDVPDTWQRAAVKLSDALTQDWHFNLAGVRQCSERGLNPLNFPYFARLLRPTIVCMESIALRWIEPVNQYEDIASELAQLARSGLNLNDALEAYDSSFGHLPLRDDLSVGRFIESWSAHHALPDNVWEIVWSWASKLGSPVRRYHACVLFLTNPSLIPRDKSRELWGEIAIVLSAPAKIHSADSPDEGWPLHLELTRFFHHHFECQLGFANGERVAVLASWMALRVGDALRSTHHPIHMDVLKKIASHAEITQRLWQIARPSAEPSALRLAILHVRSPWALSLEAQLAPSLHQLHPYLTDEGNRTAIETALSAAILASIGLRPPNPLKFAYGFEQDVRGSAENWIAVFASAQLQEMLNAFIPAVDNASEGSAILESLQNISTYGESHQKVVAHIVQALAHARALPQDVAWSVLADPVWREKTFAQVGLEPAVLLFDAILELQTQFGGDWCTHLPHFFAQACEMGGSSKERQNHLFAFTVLDCVATDSVSALTRLLRGPHRHDLADQVEYWRLRLDEARSVAPQWIAAKLGAISASLYVGL